MKRRVLWHVLFWLVYTLVYAYLNTAFAAPSDLKYPLAIRFWRFWQTELMVLPLNLGATYTFLYGIVPRFFQPKQYWKGVLAVLLLLLPIALLSRLMTYYAAYPFLYGEFPDYETLSTRRVLYSLLDLASAVTIASTVALLRRRAESQKKEAELVREKLISELSFLRAQTNPHFLFNTLNNIYALARKQSPQTAPVVMQLSQLMRFMLYECSEPTIPVSAEVKVIQDYIELEQLRYNERLVVQFQCQLDDPQHPIAPLLLLPLVENAFKYGVSETRFDAEVQISIILNNHHIKVHIQNAQPTDMEASSAGIGLANVQRQLSLLYPDAHRLRIDANTSTHHLWLEIQLDKAHIL